MDNELGMPASKVEKRFAMRPTVKIAGCVFAVILILVALRWVERAQPTQPPAVQPKPIVTAPVGQCLGEGLHTVIGNQIYYQYGNNCFYVYSGEADATTFQVLGQGFAKDSKHAYYQGRPISEGDARSFEAIDENHARDKQAVFSFSQSRGGHVIKDADPKTFQVLDGAFGRDKNTGFFDLDPILGSHGSTFASVPGDATSTGFYAKDRLQVYRRDKVVAGADPETFRPYPGTDDISRDAKNVFWFETIIERADPDSFRLLRDEVALNCSTLFRDKSRVFLGGTELMGADPKTFRYVGNLYSAPFLYNEDCVMADAKHVYIHDQVMEGLDSATLKLMGAYIKDAKGVYFGNTQIEGADSKTFVVLDGYGAPAKDASYIYECGARVMPNRATSKQLGEYYGVLGSAVYYHGKALAGADAKTFNVLGGSGVLGCENDVGGYAKDARSVYWAGTKIDGVDAASFKLGGAVGYGQDKKYEYVKGIKVKNDFVQCFTQASELGASASRYASSTSFEACIMPNGEKIVAYHGDKLFWNAEREYFEDRLPSNKTLEWLDAKNQVLRKMDFVCPQEYSRTLPRSIRALDGDILTLTCGAVEACDMRAFNDLSLSGWKSSGTATTTPRDEYYDCGYRG